MGDVGRGVYFFEGYILDLTRGCVCNANGEIELRPKSFQLLSYLVRNAGRLISKDELVDKVWPNVTVSDDSLAQCISDVRRALSDADRRIIKTVPRRGYLFAAPVSVSKTGIGPDQPLADSSDESDAEDRIVGGPAFGAVSCNPLGASTNTRQTVVRSTSFGQALRQPDPPRRGLATHFVRMAMAVSAIAAIGIGIAVWWASPHDQGSPLSADPPVASAPQMLLPSRNSSAPLLSLAVLPVTNLSSDPDQEHFADGITDDLTTDLSRISESFVIARNTAASYKGKAVDAKQIGRDLGVRYLVQSSVRPAGDQILVNLQLVDAESGANVWADRFETDRQDLAQAQGEITSRLARTLNIELLRDAGRRVEVEQVARSPRDLVMRGWARYYRPATVSGVREARGDFESALDMDPQSVEARIGTALTLLGAISVGWSRSVERDEGWAEQLLHEALERDTTRSMVHVAIGILRRIQVRLSESKMEFETAIALDRNNAQAIFQLGQTMMWLGQPAAGIPLLEKSIRLHPRDPMLASPQYGIIGLCHLLLGQTDQAIDLIARARANNPRFYYVHLWLAGALGFKGDLEPARAALAQAIKIDPRITSFAAQRADAPYIAYAPHWALREKTLNLGLRRIGHPEE